MTENEQTALALRSIAARLARRLRVEAGHADYTSAQLAVIKRLLDDGPATTSELARDEDMRPQSMSAIVVSLEKAGVVERRPDPNDGRAVRVSMTANGTRAVHEGRAAKQEWLLRMLSERLSTAEQHTMAEAVGLLERLLAP